MSTVFYIDCFSAQERPTIGLAGELTTWMPALTGPRAPWNLDDQVAATPNDLRRLLERFIDQHEEGDVLILGGHGHPSLQGFWVDDTPVRWHDVAFLLRGRMHRDTEFVFYSCNGGYPGISHVFGRDTGPNFVWGPRITVLVSAMRHATRRILESHSAAQCSQADKVAVVDAVNGWAQQALSGFPDHEQFLRVWWSERSGGRHPNAPSHERPDNSEIDLIGWRL